jgi:hypothetical protein
MKTYIPHFFYKLLILSGLLFVSNGCDKSLDLPEHAALRLPRSMKRVVTGKPYVLKSAADFAVPEPKSINSAEYGQEIEEIKALQATLTDDQKAKIQYWNTEAFFAGMR